MKKTSKIISILLVAIMTLSIFAVSASAIATPLTAGNSKETATNIPSYGVAYTSTLSKAGEQDWFKLTTLSEDAYYTIALENYDIYQAGSSDFNTLNLFVYDTYNKQIIHIHNTSSTNIKLERNTTYYVKVCMGSNVTSSTGNYAIAIRYKLDTVSNIKDEATTIGVNNTYKYSLDGSGDSDWYKFTAPVDSTYKVSLENYDIYQAGSSDYNTLNLYIYDPYNKTVLHIHNTSSANVKLESSVTYYILITMGNNVKSSIGNYGFSVTCDDAPIVTPPTETKTLSSISIASYPSKITYEIGESFDKSGLVVKAHYSDGSTANVASYSISGFDSSSAGTKALTISYTENDVTKTASFNISVEKAEEPSDPDSSEEPGSSSAIDITSIFVAIWEFIVDVFNFIIGIFDSVL